MDNKNKNHISYELLTLIMQYIEIDNSIRNYGTNVQIYHSEIHMISAIAENPGIHIRGLAEQMGTASASVSEMVKKLEKKRLIRKEVSPDNQSRLSLYVTTKGQLAHEEHRRYHKLIDDAVNSELSDATDDQLIFLNDFIQGLYHRLDGLNNMI